MLSEDVFQSTHNLSEALHILIPRAKAGEYPAIFALNRIVVLCKPLKARGAGAFDDYVSGRSVLKEPLRQAEVSRLMLYCQDGDKDLAEARKVVAGMADMEAAAIKAGNPLPIVAGLMRGDTQLFAPQYATPDAVDKAIADVDRNGTPWEKYQSAFLQLGALQDPDVLTIDMAALKAGAGDLTDLHLASAQLYGCEVGKDCGPQAEWHVSACLQDGWCQQGSLGSYLRDYKLDATQKDFVDRYLAYLRAKAKSRAH